MNASFRKSQLFITVVGVVVFVSAGCEKKTPNIATVNQASSDQSKLVAESCWFSVPVGWAIDCFNFTSAGTHKRFNLPVVIFRNQSSAHRNDPLVYLSGGPGSDNFLGADNSEHWVQWLQRVNIARDLIVMEFRGTGRSQPQYRCRAYEQQLRDSLGRNQSLADDGEALLVAMGLCLDEFRQRGFASEDFSTSVYADDLYRLQQLLEINTWNLMGASYGSRVAMDFSRRYPAATRAMVLDSVYPPGKGGLLSWPENLANSFAALWDECVNQGDVCDQSAFTAERFWQTVRQLNDNPIEVQVKHWDGGWPIDAVINGHRFVFVVYNALYRNSGISMVKTAVAQLASGETAMLTTLVERSVNSDLDSTFNPFTFFMVDCAETPTPTAAEFEVARQRYPAFDGITANAVELDVCRLFPQLASYDNFSTLHLDTTPALFLSGALDPVTPAQWVEDVIKYYPNGHSWIFPTISHGVMANSDCAVSAVRSFLDSPTTFQQSECASE